MPAIDVGRKLPEGYTPCKYLRSNANQGINTLVTSANGTNRMIADIEYTSLKSGKQHMGFRGNDTWGATGTVGTGYPIGGTLDIPFFSAGVRTVIDSLCEKPTGARKMWQDGVLVCNISNTDTTIGYINSLFYVNDGSVQTCNVKIYSAQVYLDDDIKWDGVPCLDPNGKPCFYDFVTQTPFYNNRNTTTREFGYETEDGTVVAPK